MSYRVIGSRVLLGHRVTGSSGLSPAFSPSPYLQGHHGHRVTITMVLGHHGLGSRVTRVTGSRVTMSHHHPGHRVTHHPHPGHPSPWVSGLGSLWSRVTGSPWSQGHPSPGISNLPSPGLQGYHHHGHRS